MDARDGRHRPTRRRWSFPIGRIAGIQIRVHATFFLLPVLFFVPGAPWSAFASAMLWLAVIFACVVVHELAHSILAVRRGGTVSAIVLLPIGGVSQLERMPDNPTDELHIAVAGPLASFSLAALAAVTAVALGYDLWPIGLSSGAFLTRLVWFNLIVGGFNLVPAFPLDGGRILRAWLQRRSNLERATGQAARVGRAIGLILVGAGVFVDLWLAIIGLFVFFAASAEESGTIVHARLRGMTVKDLMVPEPVVVDPSTPGAWIRHIAGHAGQRSLPVVDAGRYAGMVSAEDAERRHELTADELADTGAPTLSPDDDLEEAIRTLGRSSWDALAVLEDERVVGLLRTKDAARLVRTGRTADRSGTPSAA